MKHLDLFSGIGGFALAASWVWGEQHEIHRFVEIEQFAQKVLKKHWPDVPIHGDIKTYEHDGTPIDIISGGFPCQPYSKAGKRLGKKDDRALWPEMLRVIKEAKPRWIIGENVTGFISLGLEGCLSDLESEGYETAVVVIPACAVGAPHRRDRVWIIANYDQNRLQGLDATDSAAQISEEEWTDVARVAGKIQSGRINSIPESWIVRKNARIPGRVDRTKAIGNAIVPQVAKVIFSSIKTIDDL